MRLIFKYADAKTLSFDIEASKKESDRLKESISKKLPLKSKLEVTRNQSGTFRYTIKKIDIRNFLFKTEECFLDAKVGNWIEFITAIEQDTKRDLSFFKNQNQNLLGAMHRDILLTINHILPFSEQSALKKTYRKARKDLSQSFKDLLRTHFPMDYEQLQNRQQPDTALEEEKKCVDYSAQEYKQAFDRAYVRDYRYLSPAEKILFSLFKTGNLNEIDFSLVNSSLYLCMKLTDANNISLIAWAYLNKHQAILDYFLKECGHLPILGYTKLHWAIICNQPKKTFLDQLEQQADIDAQTDEAQFSMTPLMFAASLGNLEFAQLLIANEADVSIVNSTNRTALIFAAEGNHLEIVLALLRKDKTNIDRKSNGGTALTQAALRGHLAVVKALVENGADTNIIAHLTEQNETNAPTRDRGTALTAAALSGHLNVVCYLIEKANASFEKQLLRPLVPSRLHPLNAAVCGGHLNIVRYLVEKHKVDIAITENDGYSDKIAQARKDHPHIFNYLEEVKRKNSLSYSPRYSFVNLLAELSHRNQCCRNNPASEEKTSKPGPNM